MNVEELFQLGRNYHRTGRLDRAEEVFTRIIGIEPGHAEALNMLGVVASETGRHERGAKLIERAVSTAGPEPSFLSNLGYIYLKMGRTDESLDRFRAAVDADSSFAGAYHGLGSALSLQGRLEDAARCFRRAANLNPGFAPAHFELGRAYDGLGRTREAAHAFMKAVEIQPDLAAAYVHLGQALKALGELEGAVWCYSRLAELQPRVPEAHYRLAGLLFDTGRLEAAVGHYRQALALRPDYFEALFGLGLALADQRRFEEALAAYRKAEGIRPEAAQLCHNLGNVCESLGRDGEASDYYRRALILDPELRGPYSPVMFYFRQTCAWKEAEVLAERLDELTEADLKNGRAPGETPFISLIRHADPERNAAVARAWSDHVRRSLPVGRPVFDFGDRRRADGRLRVGYLSADFRDHPVAFHTAGIFERHDRSEVEVIGYSTGPDDGGGRRLRIERACDQFVDLSRLGDVQAARRIYEDRVDVLVDLTGHTGDHRLSIAAMRPAPLQVSYLGFLGTTGADFFDYLIADPVVVPVEESEWYTESLVRLPDCYQMIEPPSERAGRGWERRDAGLPEDAFVFCSFNNPYKIEPLVFEVWMNVLRRVSGSVLWLYRRNSAVEARLREEARLRGIDPGRLVFAETVSMEEHRARLELADLALDTTAYNGGSTTALALSAGLPVVAVLGRHFVSRMSASNLMAAGLPEPVCGGRREYEDLAVDLAMDQGRLAEWRRRLIGNQSKAPLFDAARFTRGLERAYRMMWERFAAGEAPAPIAVPPDPFPGKNPPV